MTAGWDNFYVIVGSAAGALIGLQFVVMALIADSPAAGSAEAGAAFGTPTIVHFATVLLLAANVCIPWRGIGVAIVWGLAGLAGLFYTGLVVRRILIQHSYHPVLEDWLFHGLLPGAAYGLLVGSAFLARDHARRAMFILAAATLLLLFIAIHNAWDAVTYHVYYTRRAQKKAEPS